ncbi:MAG: glycosyltransferase N-terminal domain-containing protein [Calditrichaceae bacterium]
MWRYRLLLLVVSLPLIIVSLWQAIKYRDARLLLQRLGFALPVPGKPVTWIHAASVGEVNAVIPFIKLLREQHADKPLLVTTNTPTGKRVLQKHFSDIPHSYLVMDCLWLNRIFVKSVQPRCALIFETEIWPNLFATLENKTETVGNIKYAASSNTDVSAIDLGRPYILAASTRDGEEKYIVEALQELLDEHLLVIAPRHPQRLTEIEKDLADLGINVAIRSRNEPVTENTRVYLADTLGELGQFIAGSQFVLMGGAFLPFGGHNILEVGQADKAVIFGTHMENFADEAASYVAAHAAIQVSSNEELRQAVLKLIEQPGEAGVMGKNGQALMQEHAAIAQTYLDRISQLCQL